MNWRPVTAQEQEIFDKRRELHVKTRRKHWTMKYNPKTSGFYSDIWSDRAQAQWDWSNSQWFRMTADQYWSSAYWNNVSFRIIGQFSI